MSEQATPVTTLLVTGTSNRRIINGFALTDPYIEACWASALGPTAVVLARRFGLELDRVPSLRMDAAVLARSLGVGTNRDGPGVGRTSPLMRAVGRLERFGFLTQDCAGPEVRLTVFREVPGLTSSHLRRVPQPTLVIHEALTRAHLEAAGGRGPSAPQEGLESLAVRSARSVERLRRPRSAAAFESPESIGR